jgi:hypothetical protein
MKALNGMLWAAAVRTLKLTVKSWASVTWSEHAEGTSSTVHQNLSFDRVDPCYWTTKCFYIPIIVKHYLMIVSS